MKSFNLKIRNGRLAFVSEHHQALFNQFLSDHNGKEVEVKLKKSKVSDQLRGFYFSAVIPVVRSTCDEWANLSGDQLHEVLKKMFNYFEAYHPINKRTERFGRPTMSDNEWTSTGKAMGFLAEIQVYLEGCGKDMPSSEDWLEEQGFISNRKKYPR